MNRLPSVWLVCLCLALVALTAVSAPARFAVADGADGDDEVIAVKAATVWTGAGKSIANGVVLVRGGKIEAVGAADKVKIPEGARVIDVPEGFLMPGVVVPYSRQGLFGGAASPIGSRGSSSRRFQNLSDQKAAATLYPRQTVFRDLREAGVTTVGLVPGSGGGITGTFSVIRPAGSTRAEMILAEGALLRIAFGGGSSAKSGLKTLLDRARSETEKVEKARAKRAEWEKREAAKRKKEEEKRKKEAKKKDAKPAEAAKPAKPAAKKSEGPKVPELKANIAPIAEAREGKLKVLLEVTNSAVLLHLDEILGDRHQLDYILVANGRTAVQEVKRLKQDKIPVLLAPTLTTRPPTNVRINPAAILEDAGVEFAFRPAADSVAEMKALFFRIAQLVKCGLGRDAALAAVTRVPAGWLGVKDRVGTLEKGKAANLLLFTGDPLASPLATVHTVILDGAVVRSPDGDAGDDSIDNGEPAAGRSE